MDYDLSRIDYAICGITYPDTLKVLPLPGPKLQQKFAIGDKNGVLQCLSIKDEEPVVQFKTLPGKPITSVQLASTTGVQADKIFAASGNEVKGYTKKGKVFLTIETSLTETITSMCVLGGDLILCSGKTVSYYRDLREFHSYVCEDRVLDIAAFATPNSARVRLLVLVANKGAVVLEGGQLVSRTAISSGPSRLAVPVTHHSANICAYYGAADGSIGLISHEESVLTSQCLVEGRGLGSVVCLGWYFSNGGMHLAVGRHDGSIQLYLVDMDNMADKPRLKFTYFCGEPVTSVAGGCVGTEENELIAATFSGRVFALRSRRFTTAAAALSNIPHDALAARRTKLEAEVARLEKQVANERDKYQRSTRSLHAGLSTPPLLDIQYELSGATREGWQEIKIIAAVPLDMLFVYCNRKLDIITDSTAVLSICPSQGNEDDLLATVRCQAGTRRLWVRLRYLQDTKRGPRLETGKVLIYALPAAAPRVARLITLQLPALPYYSVHEDMDIENDNRTWSQVRATGSFSVAEMTAWLTKALPGERGSAVFKSDNVSTAAVMRDVVSDCSVEKSIHIEITCDVPDYCCLQSFKRIEDQYKEQYQRNKDAILREALSHLDLDANTMEVGANIMCEEYLRIWESSLTEDAKDIHFDELVDTIEQWYVDWRTLSLSASDFNKERAQLREALRECRIEQITKILSNEELSPEEYY
ncbi:bardet-Biedl syndrome 7 protein [Phthorimaea operculella]|nr:bardet-Biedl syndrome 7 protein [Phthorimaea operculella]